MAILNRGKMNLIVGIGNRFDNQIFMENVHEPIIHNIYLQLHMWQHFMVLKHFPMPKSWNMKLAISQLQPLPQL
jgi:hypothetical protein